MATDRPCHTFADGMNAHAPNPGGSIPFLPVERRRDIFVLFGGASTDAVTAEKINRIFRMYGGLFGKDGIDSTAIVQWAVT